ncbi:MAG: porin [Flavobacterium sp.]|jgi:hypothetical protein|nr:porin [Flavobacterium sp.]
MKKLVTFSALLLACASFAQGSPDYGGGLKFKVNDDGSKYMRFIAWNQIWLRSQELNPGSMIADEASTTNTDIANRRLRLLAYAQISPRYMIVTHIGINNQTFTNGGAQGATGTGGYGAGKKPGLFFHDAWNEYALVLPQEGKKFSMTIGGGLHYYMGLSRMTMSSTLNYMTIDAPIFNWPLIENSDQFARQIGIFAKGKYDKIEYRFSINKPYATNLVPTDVTDASNAIAVDNNGNAKWSKAGYVEYQFFDSESNFLPFKVGSYLGTKKMLNVGAGFYVAPESSRSSVNGIIEKHDTNLFALDVFADLPIGTKEKKMAFTGYSVFYSYDFGPNYLRNIGIMNTSIADPNFVGNRPISGVGNSQPMIGTGNIWYTQAGFLLPNAKEKPKVRIQPFTAFTHKNFEALDKSSNQFDFGANFFLDGHHAKITTQYSTRPVYLAPNETTSKGELIVQLQIYL